MCLGRASLDEPHLCGLAEQVLAAVPWPCVVMSHDDGRAILVNAAFRDVFGVGRERENPDWLTTVAHPTLAGNEFVHRHGGTVHRYRLTRQTIDVPSARLQAVFLTRLPDDDAPMPGRLPTRVVPATRPDVSLTRRESQVLDGIMSGKLNKVIASELDISPKTVELHRANLMAKLRVHNVVELARVVLDGPSANIGVAADES